MKKYIALFLTLALLVNYCLSPKALFTISNYPDDALSRSITYHQIENTLINISSEEEISDYMKNVPISSSELRMFFCEKGIDPAVVSVKMLKNGSIGSYPAGLWGAAEANDSTYGNNRQYFGMAALDFGNRNHYKENEAYYMSTADSIIQSFNLPANATVPDKLFALYKYFCDNYTYQITDDNCLPKFLSEKIGVCADSARMANIVLDRMGIPTICLSTQNHAWNYVKIGDYWYFIDYTNALPAAKGDYSAFSITNKKGLNISGDTPLANGETTWQIFDSAVFQAEFPLSPTAYDMSTIEGTLPYKIKQAQEKETEKETKDPSKKKKSEDFSDKTETKRQIMESSGGTVTTTYYSDQTKKVVRKNNKKGIEKATVTELYNQSGKLTSATAVCGNVKYSLSGKKAIVSGTASKSASTLFMHDFKTVGKSYKVSGIKKNAFKGNKKLKKVIWGSNGTCPKKIPANAFKGCKNLKTVMIKGTQLKKIGKNAFKGIHKKAVFQVPKSKKAAYKKLLTKKTGYKRSMKIRVK